MKHNILFSKKIFVISMQLITAISFLLLNESVFADVIDDAASTDISELCASNNSDELYKIASKKSNSAEIRREALVRMIEVSRECANASENRLRQYHHKTIGAAKDLLTVSDISARRSAVEAYQYVALLPDNVQPTQGAITRGQTLANAALNDSDTAIRLWALEALVTVRGDHPTVQNTLATAAANDSEQVVRDTASNMLSELY